MNKAFDIEDHEPAESNRLLEKFYAEAKSESGQDYEADSLRVMIAALDKHLREKQYPFSILKDRDTTRRNRSQREKRKYYDRLVEVSARTRQEI